MKAHQYDHTAGAMHLDWRCALSRDSPGQLGGMPGVTPFSIPRLSLTKLTKAVFQFEVQLFLALYPFTVSWFSLKPIPGHWRIGHPIETVDALSFFF